MLAPPPGLSPYPDALARRLADALAAKGPGYVPRTHHLVDGRPKFTNRLVLERSPYLLQHAHNPVAWFPWGDEAFEEARRTGRPVFLSVGYSTCHWCHVMERESFEDETIARVMNTRYVPIKVDREERPDVDAIYMTAVQLLTGGGGWPMSVWLTPDREPFFGGTYFPPRDGARGAQRGFLSILEEIAALWENDPERVKGATGSLVQAVKAALAPQGAPSLGIPGPEPIERAVGQVRANFDERRGGLRRAPKFPSSLPVRLLLRHHRRTKDARSLHMAELSLEKMAAGGLMDQVGGGFHRYSTDADWLVPHFEKMLYDNALLAVAYAEAWQVTGRRDFARVVRQTLDYVLREMTAPEGGFWSATDADSESVEGKFFVWSEAELREALGADAERFIRFYGVTPEGNFEEQNILFVPRPDEEEWAALEGARRTLYERRAKRMPPLRDEKILTAWNGLMISALAFGGRVLHEPRYVDAAARAADFVLRELVRDGRLLRAWLGGDAGVPGFLEDHAFLAQGLLDLFEATFEPRWLTEAIRLAGAMERLFGDPAGGGWFTTATDHEQLLAREKPTHDGAEPSGASIALQVVLRLHAFTTDDRWRRSGEGALKHYANLLDDQPLGLAELLVGLDRALDTVHEVVLVWPQGEPPPERFLDVLRRQFLPSRALAGAEEGEALRRLGMVAPVAAEKVTVGGKTTAYVCERGLCRMPAIAPEKLLAQIAPARPYR
jgi:uncharacterized protein